MLLLKVASHPFICHTFYMFTCNTPLEMYYCNSDQIKFRLFFTLKNTIWDDMKIERLGYKTIWAEPFYD